MMYRQAAVADIQQIQVVRNAVKENQLSNPLLVTDADVADYITNRGRGWVAEEAGMVIGFSIVSITDNNVWALFILPEFEGKGIGKNLHTLMMDWYFSETDKTIWLSTGVATRAATFYALNGWIQNGIYGKNELKFEMTADIWHKLKNK